MAPSAVETITVPVVIPSDVKFKQFGAYKDLATDYSPEGEIKGTGEFEAAKYPHYLPALIVDEKFPPLTPFDHVEHGIDADTTFPDLLPNGKTQVTHLTPSIGSEVSGIQLSSLSNAGKDQLARFVAERKVVVFQDQDFADLPIQEALDYGSYFGRLHVHPSSQAPKGYPAIHLVHRGANDRSFEDFFTTRTSSVAWHSDVSYEEQPPGLTFLYILDKPESGGDTLFVDAVEAYNRLSPAFQERLHGLKATHTGVDQANSVLARGGVVRREAVISEHPIVRTHPATGEKALYVNPQFTREIVGMKKEESDALLKFLYDHLAYGADFQCRVKWGNRSVTLWDNRVTQHSALVDWKTGQRRHLARITPQAERPYETPFKA